MYSRAGRKSATRQLVVSANSVVLQFNLDNEIVLFKPLPEHCIAQCRKTDRERDPVKKDLEFQRLAFERPVVGGFGACCFLSQMTDQSNDGEYEHHSDDSRHPQPGYYDFLHLTLLPIPVHYAHYDRRCNKNEMIQPIARIPRIKTTLLKKILQNTVLPPLQLYVCRGFQSRAIFVRLEITTTRIGA